MLTNRQQKAVEDGNSREELKEFLMSRQGKLSRITGPVPHLNTTDLVIPDTVQTEEQWATYLSDNLLKPPAMPLVDYLIFGGWYPKEAYFTVDFFLNNVIQNHILPKAPNLVFEEEKAEKTAAIVENVYPTSKLLYNIDSNLTIAQRVAKLENILKAQFMIKPNYTVYQYLLEGGYFDNGVSYEYFMDANPSSLPPKGTVTPLPVVSTKSNTKKYLLIAGVAAVALFVFLKGE